MCLCCVSTKGANHLHEWRMPQILFGVSVSICHACTLLNVGHISKPWPCTHIYYLSPCLMCTLTLVVPCGWLHCGALSKNTELSCMYLRDTQGRWHTCSNPLMSSGLLSLGLAAVCVCSQLSLGHIQHTVCAVMSNVMTVACLPGTEDTHRGTSGPLVDSNNSRPCPVGSHAADSRGDELQSSCCHWQLGFCIRC